VDIPHHCGGLCGDPAGDIPTSKAQNELEAQEKTLSAVTAQFNSECRLQAKGETADPQKYRDAMSRSEQRAEAAREQQWQIECDRFKDLRQKYG
jgi:hypothetical protein